MVWKNVKTTVSGSRDPRRGRLRQKAENALHRLNDYRPRLEFSSDTIQYARTV